jgi:hypothetical protein
MASLDVINEFDSQKAFNRARRGAIAQKIVCAIQGCSPDLIPFDEAREQLHLNQKICLGLHEIELKKIRGSVGRYQDFTSAFLPRQESLRERWQNVRTASISKGLPPIELYKVGQAYFVADGNHRVSIAIQEGLDTIEAYVCEYVTLVELSAEADLDELLTKAEYAEFLTSTHLQPDQPIEFTVSGRYMELEIQISSVQQTLEHERGEPIAYSEAAQKWYQEIYIPTVQEIRESKILDHFPERTEADLFIWMWRKENELQIESGPISDTELNEAFN